MIDPLLVAILDGDADKVDLLLAAGTDCNAVDTDGVSALMHAAHMGNLAIVNKLIETGADVNWADASGWSALVKAAYNADRNCGFPEVVQALIDAGADVEAPLSYGVRPLMLAAAYGETAVVEVLLQAGVDVLARNHGGLTALMMVKEKHYVDVINLLHEAERDAGVGEGSCSTKNPPGSQVVTFLKPVPKS